MLEINNISKIYSNKFGMENISLSIKEGEIISFIGPNGAGKSTLFKLIAGVLKLDKGQISLNGQDVSLLDVKRKIGYLPDDFYVNPKIKVKELLYTISDYRFEGHYKNEIEQAMIDYKIQQYSEKKFRELSMGTRKKLGLIIAFMGTPELIILDEPTNGIDTEGIIRLKENVIKAKQQGSIIIISSHILDFVESIADKSVFLCDGKIKKIAKVNENLEAIYEKLYL